jgi:predicted RNA binding protein YcfA (HicA-like mRNA interferase family)
MAATFDRELKKILQEAGCHYVRPAKGSHEIWHSPLTNRHFTVPANIVIRHTANGVLKQAGLPKAF